MKLSALFVSCLLALSGSAALSQDPASAQAVDICSVTSDPIVYEGKEIVVRGLWRMIIHGSILWGKACPTVEVNLTEAAGFKANKKALSLVRSLAKKDQFGSVEVIFRATFIVAHEGQSFGQICAPY
jgi:hypothetical protein